MTKVKHGTKSMYVRGCRCASCRAANTSWAREYRERRKSGAYEPSPPKEQPRPPKPKPCDCPVGYCAMERIPKSLRAEKAIQRMRDRAVDEGKSLVCRKRPNG